MQTINHQTPFVNWRNISITLKIPGKGEEKARTCGIALISPTDIFARGFAWPRILNGT
jgi:hypothetical protein